MGRGRSIPSNCNFPMRLLLKTKMRLSPTFSKVTFQQKTLILIVPTPGGPSDDPDEMPATGDVAPTAVMTTVDLGVAAIGAALAIGRKRHDE